MMEKNGEGGGGEKRTIRELLTLELRHLCRFEICVKLLTKFWDEGQINPIHFSEP